MQELSRKGKRAIGRRVRQSGDRIQPVLSEVEGRKPWVQGQESTSPAGTSEFHHLARWVPPQLK